MSNDAIPKLRVVDGSGGAGASQRGPAPTSAKALPAEPQVPAASARPSWPMILLFLAGAIGGGAGVPLLTELLR